MYMRKARYEFTANANNIKINLIKQFSFVERDCHSWEIKDNVTLSLLHVTIKCLVWFPQSHMPLNIPAVS
jgi:hypothetical protein